MSRAKPKAKFDRCWGCGAFTPFVCFRCGKPVCVAINTATPAVGCGKLRAAPSQPGCYHLVCTPRCRLRRTPQVLAIIEKHEHPTVEALRSELDDALFAATNGHAADCTCSWCGQLSARLAEIESKP